MMEKHLYLIAAAVIFPRYRVQAFRSRCHISQYCRLLCLMSHYAQLCRHIPEIISGHCEQEYEHSYRYSSSYGSYYGKTAFISHFFLLYL